MIDTVEHMTHVMSDIAVRTAVLQTWLNQPG